MLVADGARGAHFLNLVDLVGNRGVIWEHEIYKGFEYYQDRPFFHSFAGDVRAKMPLHVMSTDTHGAGLHDWHCLAG